jgi:hypothetical protein
VLGDVQARNDNHDYFAVCVFNGIESAIGEANGTIAQGILAFLANGQTLGGCGNTSFCDGLLLR